MYVVNRASYPNVFTDRPTRALNLESIVAKVATVRNLSTIEFGIETGTPYFDIPSVLNSLCDAAHRELSLLETAGLSPFLFALSATFTQAEAKEFFAPRVVRSLRSKHRQMFGDDRGIEIRFEMGNFVKSGALLPLARKALFEAIVYSYRKTYSLVILSDRPDFCSEKNLRQIFSLASIDFNGELSNTINEGLVSALICPLGDVVIKTHGEFDDPGRDLQFIFAPEARPALLALGM